MLLYAIGVNVADAIKYEKVASSRMFTLDTNGFAMVGTAPKSADAIIADAYPIMVDFDCNLRYLATL